MELHLAASISSALFYVLWLSAGESSFTFCSAGLAVAWKEMKTCGSRKTAEKWKLTAAFWGEQTDSAEREILSGRMKSVERNPIAAALKHELFFLLAFLQLRLPLAGN